MNEHDRIRELLALAAAGTLSDAEATRVTRHAADCPECEAELGRWRSLAATLGRIPTPQAPAAMVQRTRAQLAARFAGAEERRTNQWLVAFAILLSWTITLGGWMVFRVFQEGIPAVLEMSGGMWTWLVGYTVVGWMTAAVAAAVLGLRYRRTGRTV
jgi:anti-sigma factor RsiW